jgi:hypothetical protein
MGIDGGGGAGGCVMREMLSPWPVIKILPSYPGGTSRGAGKLQLPGRPGSQPGKIFPIFSVHDFFGTDFTIRVNLITNFWAGYSGSQVRGKSELWILKKSYRAIGVSE